MDIKANCRKYLTDNNIFFKNTVKFYENTPQQLILDFIIPGGIIKLMGKKSTQNAEDIMEKILEISPKDFIIYTYFNKPPPDYILEEIENPRIKIINKFEEIKQLKFEFHTNNYSFLTSLGSEINNEYDSLIEKYKKFTFIVNQNCYTFCTVLMNDVEIERLNKFNIKIKNDISESDIIINNTLFQNIDLSKKKYEIYNKIKINEKFNYFNINWNKYSVDSTPKKHIEGFTIKCKLCNMPNFSKYIQDGICRKTEQCSVNIQRRLPNSEVEASVTAVSSTY